MLTTSYSLFRSLMLILESSYFAVCPSTEIVIEAPIFPSLFLNTASAPVEKSNFTLSVPSEGLTVKIASHILSPVSLSFTGIVFCFKV